MPKVALRWTRKGKARPREAGTREHRKAHTGSSFTPYSGTNGRREWAGARELVDSSYQPTYVVLEGHNPIPSALSCTFLPANRQATSIFKGNGRTTRIPVPLHPPWATTRFGIEYVGISRRDWPVFLPDFDAVIRVRTWVLRLGGERLNHYATCLTSRRTMVWP